MEKEKGFNKKTLSAIGILLLVFSILISFTSRVRKFEVKNTDLNHQIKKKNRTITKFRKPNSVFVEKVKETKGRANTDLSESKDAFPFTNETYVEAKEDLRTTNSLSKRTPSLDLIENLFPSIDDFSIFSGAGQGEANSTQNSHPNESIFFGNSPWHGGTSQGTTGTSSKSTKTEKPKTPNPPRLFGKVIPLEGVIANNKFELISSAYAAINCNNPRIQLFDLMDMSILMDNPITEDQINGLAEFEIKNLNELKIDFKSPSRYMLQTAGCDKYLQRIVTSYYERQDLTDASTLISYIINTEYDGIITNPQALENLYKIVHESNVSTDHLDDIFQEAINNPASSELFRDISAGLPMEELQNALPRLHLIKYETSLEEKRSYQYAIEASHWSENYTIFYEWKINGTTVSNSPNWTYTPSANSPNQQEIILLVGKKDEFNDIVDRNELYHEFKWDIGITNTYPALAPTLNIASPSINPTNDSDIFVELDSHLECETFSSFAISEGIVDPGSLDYSLSCLSPKHPLSISQIEDGNVTFYVWSKDIENRISYIPTVLNIVLDKTQPEMNFRGLRSFYDADTEFNISWDLTETNAHNSQTFMLEFFDGSDWTEIANPALTNGPHEDSIFESNVAFPNSNITGARLRLTYKDLATNETIIESDPFNIVRPELSSTPATISFPDTYNLATSSELQFSFDNTSIVDSKTCQIVSISGTHAADFTITENNCSLSSIGANSSCDMALTATPSGKGSRTATINLSCGNESYSTTLRVESLNNPPVVADAMTHTMRDNTSWNFTIPEGSDLDNTLAELTYKITEGPAIGTLSSCLPLSDFNSSRSCSYTAPENFNGTVTIRYLISDGTDESRTEGLITINVEDQTATSPNLSPYNFTNGSYSTQNLLTFTAQDCDDVSAIIIQESSTPPSLASASWQSCVMTNGGISFNPQLSDPPVQGSRTIYAFAKDPQNNLSSAVSFNFIYDNINPEIETETVPTLPAAEKYTLSWTLTEDHSSSAQNFSIEFFNGAEWTNLTTVPLTNGPHDEASFSFEYNIPNENITGAKYRISYTDLAGLSTSQESNSFNIVRPVLSSNPTTLSFADTLNLATRSLSFNFTNSSIVASKVCSEPEITGTHASDFSITSDGCTDERIAASGSCPMEVSVTPSARGTRTATITLECGVDTYSTTLQVNSLNNPPAATDLALYVRDDADVSFSFPVGVDSDHETSDLTYIVTEGPVQGALISCPASASASSTRSCTYSSPLNFHGEVTIKYKISDGLNDSNEAVITITVEDLTPTQPNVYPQNFTAGASTNLPSLTLLPNNCNDVLKIFIQEDNTAPTETSEGWQACNIGTSLAYNPLLSNTQGFRTLRIYGIDQNNNISTPQLISFIYDTLPPQISIQGIPTLPTSISYPIRWTLTEASVGSAAQFTIQYSLDNGNTWTSTTQTVGKQGPFDSEPFTYHWNVPNYLTTEALIRISLTDDNGMTGSSTSNLFEILHDLEAPNFRDNMMTINGSSTPTATPQKYAYVSFEAYDSDTTITHFCIKNTATSPSVNDSCWRAVDAPVPGLTPDKTLTLNNYPFMLGFVPGTFNIYAWTKDLKGNISTNTNTLGRDRVTITYFGDTSPVITNFFASNNLTPPTPITDQEMIFEEGDSIHIKWKAVDDKVILNTIKLYYTLDDENFVLFANNLSNSVNNCSTLDEAGTSLDDEATGCYNWTIPAVIGNRYFRVQLIVEDDANQATSILSLPLNSNRFKIFAGNIDPGIDSHAKSAVFNPPGLYSLAVASDGKVFVRDANYGVLYINPHNGVLQQILKLGDESLGDGGPVREATAQEIYKITIDYQDRLIVWDKDRIRRITTTEPMMIETIIGATNNGPKGTETGDFINNPADLDLGSEPVNEGILQPLPNGDIYFLTTHTTYKGYFSQTEGSRLRVYRGSLSNPTITTIRPSGSGAASLTHAGDVFSLTDNKISTYMMNFNPNTSEITQLVAEMYINAGGCSFYSPANLNITSYVSQGPHPPVHTNTCSETYFRTGHDGKFYAMTLFTSWESKVSRFNSATNSYERLLGLNAVDSIGFCPDNTLATSCLINTVDYFITQNGTFFFLDNGLVRVIDDQGRVQTLYGQRLNFGDGGLAQDARFNNISFIDHGPGDNIIAYDFNEKVIREVRPNNSANQVVKIAGNGSWGIIDTGVPAINQTLGSGWLNNPSFATDPATGILYLGCTPNQICRLHPNGYWDIVFGTPPYVYDWHNRNPLPTTQTNLGSYPTSINAIYEGRMFSGFTAWNGVNIHTHTIIRETDVRNNVTYYMAGVNADQLPSTPNYPKDEFPCSNGPGYNCNLKYGTGIHSRATTFHTPSDSWLFLDFQNTLVLIGKNGTDGSITHFDTMPDMIQSILWRNDILYYCSEEGELRKRDYSDYPDYTETVLPFPGKGIVCAGKRILWKNASGEKPNRLVFPFIQNGLMGIAEYWNP